MPGYTPDIQCLRQDNSALHHQTATSTGASSRAIPNSLPRVTQSRHPTSTPREKQTTTEQEALQQRQLTGTPYSDYSEDSYSRRRKRTSPRLHSNYIVYIDFSRLVLARPDVANIQPRGDVKETLLESTCVSVHRAFATSVAQGSSHILEKGVRHQKVSKPTTTTLIRASDSRHRQ